MSVLALDCTGRAHGCEERRDDDLRPGVTVMSAESVDDQVTVIKGDRYYEITTEHGTRIILTRRLGRWMRVPAKHQDGTYNQSSADGQWQSLRWMYSLGVAQDEQFDDRNRPKVRLGHSVRLHTDFRHWWDTTRVVGVREIEEKDVPRRP